MSSAEYMYKGFLYPFRRGRHVGRDMRRLLRGVGRRRAARVNRTRRGCCCCPLVLALGLAGLGGIAGGFYLGIWLLGWA